MNKVSGNPIVKAPEETLLVSVDFTLYGLRTGESLSGTPTVTDPRGVLTISDPIVNTSTFLNARRKPVAVGKGVQFIVAGGVAGVSYPLKVSCGTDGNPAQTLVGRCPIVVSSEDDS